MQDVKSLTALRGIAALWIVLHHFWPQTDSPTPYLIAKGYLAVDLFFILSGVVLYIVYAQSFAQGQFSWRSFAVKRFARLYPVHLVTLCVAVVILSIGPSLGVQGRALPYDFGQMIALHLSLLHAWGITETGGLNYPSWSLSAEALAYLLFPLLCALALRLRPMVLLNFATLSLVAIYIFIPMAWPDQTFTRLENDWGVIRILPEFLLGMSVARVIKTPVKFRQPRPKSAPLIGLSLAMITLGLGTDLDILCVFGFATGLAGCLVRDPGAHPALTILGTMSYSLYMSHALVQIVGFKLIEVAGGYTDSEVPLLFLVPMLGAALLVAAALYHGVERPARDWLVRQWPPANAAPSNARRRPT